MQPLMAEIGDRVDRSRTRLFGWLAPDQILIVLDVSAAHIYLTRPFVLSWGCFGTPTG
jgi:hypothetical protein